MTDSYLKMIVNAIDEHNKFKKIKNYTVSKSIYSTQRLYYLLIIILKVNRWDYSEDNEYIFEPVIFK